jgi:DNA-binding transcriptional MerR regulator
MFSTNNNIQAMYYPCQPWDTSLGIATSLLHRIGVGSDDISSDPYGILESLPLKPGAMFNIDLFRRRLTAHLLDEKNLLEINFSEILVILDDVHNIGTDGANFFGALLQVSESTKMRLLLISRSNLAFYDRRDVHTRGKVEELILSGLNLEEIKEWLDDLEISNNAPVEEIFTVTGGHPLALELLEIYGNTLHEDWLRFLDEEILDVLPKDHRELLAFLAVSDTPVPWKILAKASNFNGKPPKNLIERGLMLELEGGMWLHEALRSRLLREVGTPLADRAKKLGLN